MCAMRSPSYSNVIEFYSEIAKKAVQLFYPEVSSIRLLNYSENITYLAERKDGKGSAILRLNRPGYHTKKELEAELIWMKAIKNHTSIIVPEPIAGANGQFIQEIADVNNSGQPYHCVMFSYLKGETPDEMNENELLFHFENLGEITAHLHNHVENWKESKIICRPTWEYETMLGKKAKWGRWQDGLGITPQLVQLFEKVSNTIYHRLNRFGKTPDRFGLIHADLRLANLLVESDQLKVIDFDDCGFGWYLYDLAAALSFIEHKDYVPDLIQSWLKGYKKVRTLSKEEEEEIPTFIMLRRLMLIGWISSHSDNETAQKMGAEFTFQTVPLAEKYLYRYG